MIPASLIVMDSPPRWLNGWKVDYMTLITHKRARAKVSAIVLGRGASQPVTNNKVYYEKERSE